VKPNLHSDATGTVSQPDTHLSSKKRLSLLVAVVGLSVAVSGLVVQAVAEAHYNYRFTVIGAWVSFLSSIFFYCGLWRAVVTHGDTAAKYKVRICLKFAAFLAIGLGNAIRTLF
jgi:hypothetical protein